MTQAGGFKGKIVKSVGLTTAQFMAKFGLRLVSMFVLTRLLAPEIYGVFAIVLVFQYLLEMISDLGLRSLILTKEGEVDDKTLRTCWTVGVLRGVVIAIGAALIGLVIWGLQGADFFAADSAYSDPILPLALAAIGGVSVILNAQSMTPFVYERQMRFGHVTLSVVLSSSFGLFMTIGVAYFHPTIWALVIGSAAQYALHTAYSHLVFKGPAMGFCWDRQALDLVVARGKWLMSHSILTAITHSADRLLLGVLMSSASFGLYYIASQIREFCNSFLQMVHTRMGLQVFTHILQAPTAEFRQKYYRYRIVFDALSGVGAGALIMLAPLLMDQLLDDRYAGVAPILQILALSLLPTGPNLLRSAYSAERKFREMAYLSLMTAIVLWAGMLVAVFVFSSIEAALVVAALYRLPEALVLMIMGHRRNWIIFWRETLPLVFFAVGLGLGWSLNTLWEQLL